MASMQIKSATTIGIVNIGLVYITVQDHYGENSNIEDLSNKKD